MEVLEAAGQVHSGPHHPKAAVGHSQGAELFDFADAVLRVADDETVAGQFGEFAAELFIHCLVLAPLGIGGVFAAEVGHCGGESLLPGVVDIQLPGDGEFPGRGGVGGLGGLVVEGDLAPDAAISGVGVDIPGVAAAGGAADGGVAVGGDPDGRMRLLEGAEGHLRAVEVKVFAVKVHGFLRPETLHHFETFQVAGDPAVAGDGKGVVFRIAIAEGGAEDEAAAGDDVHSGDAFSQVNGVVQGNQYGSHDAHAFGFGGQAGEQGHSLQLLVGGGEVVLPLVEKVEAQVAGGADVFYDFEEVLPHIGADGLLSHAGQGNAELHKAS